MNEKSLRAARTAAGLWLSLSLCGLVLALSGCVGYVRGDGGEAVIVEPDVFLFGGYYGEGRYRDYGRRGYESRGGRR